MSECVHCGHCCRTMSPLSSGPCPFLVKLKAGCLDAVYVCSTYEARPKQCVDHDFPDHRWCPVGVMTLKYDHPCQYVDRVNKVWDYLHKSNEGRHS